MIKDGLLHIQIILYLIYISEMQNILITLGGLKPAIFNYMLCICMCFCTNNDYNNKRFCVNFKPFSHLMIFGYIFVICTIYICIQYTQCVLLTYLNYIKHTGGKISKELKRKTFKIVQQTSCRLKSNNFDFKTETQIKMLKMLLPFSNN